MAASKKAYEIFVSKVPWTLAHKEMKEYFAQFGTVKRCLVPFDKETGFHRGFCWVKFTTKEGHDNALMKEPHILEGAKLQVRSNTLPLTGQKLMKEDD